MATAMLDQVLYAVPKFLYMTVAQIFVSIVDWDIVYYCRKSSTTTIVTKY